MEKFEKYQLLLTAVLVAANVFLVAANFLLWRTTEDTVQQARRASQGMLVAQLNRDIFFDGRMNRVRKAIETKRPLLKPKGEVTEQDIEDYIGFFDMVYDFVKRNIIDCDLADDNFGGYVEEAYTNKEIRDYISELRRNLNMIDSTRDLKHRKKELVKRKRATRRVQFSSNGLNQACHAVKAAMGEVAPAHPGCKKDVVQLLGFIPGVSTHTRGVRALPHEGRELLHTRQPPI